MKVLIDGLFIRSLLCSFFFKLYPEIIEDKRLFIAEPPLYKVDDKKNPFAVNKEDYMNRYVKNVAKDYKIGYSEDEYMDDKRLIEFLSETAAYVDDMLILSQHYKVNARLIELILEDLAIDNKIVMDRLIYNVSSEFPEMYYDEKDSLIKGIVDGVYQSIEISDRLIRKGMPLVELLQKFRHEDAVYPRFVLRNRSTGTLYNSSVLELLKMVKKYQPKIESRFKGLGEAEPEDLEITTMNPNTRSLIRLYISDIENDMKVFQMLRGNSSQDAQARKDMISRYKINRDMLDT